MRHRGILAWIAVYALLVFVGLLAFGNVAGDMDPIVRVLIAAAIIAFAGLLVNLACAISNWRARQKQ